MLRTYQSRSDLRTVSHYLCIGATVWTNTREASPTEMQVPAPTLMFGMHSTGAVTVGRTAPAPHPIAGKPAQIVDTDATNPPKRPVRNEAAVDQGDRSVATEFPTTPLAGETQLANSEAEAHADVGADRGSTDPSPTEELVGSEVDMAVPDESPSKSEPDHQPIEISIYSLPHLQLAQPISVKVGSLDESLYTATVEALSLSGTGETLNGALKTVKAQVEQLYEKLTNLTGLDEREEQQLRYLRSVIKSDERPSQQKRDFGGRAPERVTQQACPRPLADP